MPDRAARVEHDPARNAQAVVGLLAVHEERLVEPAQRQVLLAADHHQRAGGGLDVERLRGAGRRAVRRRAGRRWPCSARSRARPPRGARRPAAAARPSRPRPTGPRAVPAAARPSPARPRASKLTKATKRPAAASAPRLQPAQKPMFSSKRSGPRALPVPFDALPASVRRARVDHDPLDLLGGGVAGERAERARQDGGAVVVDENDGELHQSALFTRRQ